MAEFPWQPGPPPQYPTTPAPAPATTPPPKPPGATNLGMTGAENINGVGMYTGANGPLDTNLFTPYAGNQSSGPPQGSIPTGDPNTFITPWGSTWTTPGMQNSDYDAYMTRAFGANRFDPNNPYTRLMKQLAQNPGSIDANTFQRTMLNPQQNQTPQFGGGAAGNPAQAGNLNDFYRMLGLNPNMTGASGFSPGMNGFDPGTSYYDNRRGQGYNQFPAFGMGGPGSYNQPAFGNGNPGINGFDALPNQMGYGYIDQMGQVHMLSSGQLPAFGSGGNGLYNQIGNGQGGPYGLPNSSNDWGFPNQYPINIVGSGPYNQYGRGGSQYGPYGGGWLGPNQQSNQQMTYNPGTMSWFGGGQQQEPNRGTQWDVAGGDYFPRGWNDLTDYAKQSYMGGGSVPTSDQVKAATFGTPTTLTNAAQNPPTTENINYTAPATGWGNVKTRQQSWGNGNMYGGYQPQQSQNFGFSTSRSGRPASYGGYY